MAYSTHSGIVKPAWRQAWGYFLRRKNGMMHSTISPRQLAKENSVISTPNVAPVEVITIAKSITNTSTAGEMPCLFFFAATAGNSPVSAAA